MTVLILTSEHDFTADCMVAALGRRDVPVARVDTAWFPQRASIDAELRDGRWVGTLFAGGQAIEVDGLRSVWYRSPSAFDFPDGLSATERNWAMNESRLGLGGVLASLPVRWVNHPSRNADAAYKPVQLVAAARCGLAVPDTLATNRPEAVHRFAKGGDVVAKAFGAASIREDGGRKTTFTHLLDSVDFADLRGVEVAVHQFQRWVPKAFEARVIAVGGRVFAAAIHAGSAETRIDWRNDYAALSYERIDPPADVVAGVRKLMSALGLLYGALDFVVRPDGQWVFLEVNAGGQYRWIEEAVGLPVTDALADLLAGGEA